MRSHEHDEHEHENAHAQAEHESPSRLPRRISRKATSSTPDRIVLPDPPWASFGNAVSAGIHAPVARKASGGDFAADAGELLSSAASTSGSALPSTIQRKFESALGADLSGVRVHTGGASEQAASAISARAYTTGQDIHFNAGQYDPGSPGGEHLLAHEVAHTVQQGSGGGGPQCKLEVSSPGDHCEVEADRAADAMVSGSVFRVTEGAGVQRAIMRTEEDETTGATTTAPTAPTPTADAAPRTGGTGGTAPVEGAGTGGSGTTGPTTVPTEWRINYDRLYGGAARSGRGAPGERSESSVLHVREFRVQPERGTTTPSTPFAGYHLQNSGAVTMGTLQHPHNVGGEASASVSYMRDRDFRLAVTGGDARLVRAAGGRAGIAHRLSAELTRQSGLPDDLSAAATALLSEAERAAGVSVAVRAAPGSHEAAVTPLPVHYGPVTGATTMEVMVQVPVGERRVIAESTSGDETEVTGSETGRETHEDGREDERGRTDTTRFVHSVESRFEAATETIARHVAEQIITNRLGFSETFELGGEAGGTLSGAIPEMTIGLSSILGRIPMIGSWLAERLRHVGPEITFSINAQLQMSVSARSTTAFTAEHTEETHTTDENSLRRALTESLTNRWESDVSREITSRVRTSRSDGSASEATTGSRMVGRHGSTSRSEGVAATQTDIPRLVLRR